MGRTISQIEKIINQGHKLIFVYPVPEMGFSVSKHLFIKYLSENSMPIVSGNYEVYKKRNELIFEILDYV